MKNLIYVLLLSTFYSFSQTSPPKITNLRVIENDNKVYFDATSDISGLTTKGFTITGKKIAGISINDNGLGGFFTTATNFSYWDNNTIRLENGDDIVPDFTLTYIKNKIPEPAATVNRYVAVGAKGNGLTIKTPASIEYAFTNAKPGETWWIKAGNYGNKNLKVGKNGTQTAPIKFVGYKNVIGDIKNNYYEFVPRRNTPLITSEMPTLTGKSRENGNAIIAERDNLIFKNLQIQNYQRGFESNATGVDNNVIENCNFKTFGNSIKNGNGKAISYSYWKDTGKRVRIKGCNLINSTLTAVTIKNNYSAILDSKSYSTETSSPGDVGLTQDYHLVILADFGIIHNSLVYKDTYKGWGHFQHGFVFKASYNASNNTYYGCNFGLISNCTAIGIKGSYELRWGTVRNCVIKNSIAHADIPNRRSSFTNTGTGGFEISNGANNNIIENIHVRNVDYFVEFQDNGEYPRDRNMAKNNIFRNIKIENVINVISANIVKSGLGSRPSGNKLYNLTVKNADRMFFMRDNKAGFTFDSSNEIVNSLFINVKEEKRGPNPPTGWNFKNSVFYGEDGHWSEKIQPGKNNVMVNPNLDSNLKPKGADPIEVSKGGQVLSSVIFDFDGVYRGEVNSIGAYQYKSGLVQKKSQYDIDYQTILDYANTNSYKLPSKTVKDAQNGLLIDLKNAGVWNELDVLYVVATDGDTNFANINWVNPGTHNASISGKLEHSINGYKGNGSKAHFNTNYNLKDDANNVSQNNVQADIFVKAEDTNPLTNGGNHALFGSSRYSTSSSQLNLYLNNSSRYNKRMVWNVNSSATGFENNMNTGYAGKLLSVTRNSSSNQGLYWDSTLIDNEKDASLAFNHAHDIYVGSHNYQNSTIRPSNVEWSLFSVGGNQVTKLADKVTAINKYLELLKTPPTTTKKSKNTTYSNEDVFKIYPNPASSIINISDKITTYTIYDVTNKKIMGGSNENNTININNLNNGVYLIVLEDSDNNLETKKFIKI